MSAGLVPWVPVARVVRVETLNSIYDIRADGFFLRLAPTEAPRPHPPSIGNRLRDGRWVPWRALNWLPNGTLQLIPGIGPADGNGIITSTIRRTRAVGDDVGWAPIDVDDRHLNVHWVALDEPSADGRERWIRLQINDNGRHRAALHHAPRFVAEITINGAGRSLHDVLGIAETELVRHT